VDQVEELLPILEQVAREGKPLVIVAENVEGQALAALIMNTVRGTMKVAAIKAPHYGEERRNTLKDLAIATGAAMVSRDTGLNLEDVKLEHLGLAKRVEASKTWTTIISGMGDKVEIQKRIDLLSAELNVIEDLQEAEKNQQRITRLSSGVAIIKVGGTTEVEMIEKKHRIEDSLSAIKSAREEGIVPGGGVALIRASETLEVETDNADQEAGVSVVKEAILEPIRQMAKNAGLSPDLIIAEVKKLKGSVGYDFANDRIIDMFEAGILDPKKVTKSALQNAVSASGTLITTNHAIVELP
jgi:chaperonin GroEL